VIRERKAIRAKAIKLKRAIKPKKVKKRPPPLRRKKRRRIRKQKRKR